MRLINLRGKLVSRTVTRYLIKWDGRSRSKVQFKVKQFLKPFWKNHVCYEEFPVFGSRMKVDLLNATRKLAVEVHGSQHETFNRFFHDNSRVNFLKSIGRDNTKLEWLTLNGFTLIEIYEHEADKLTVGFFKEKFNINLV
jgi:hypothetical protein